MNIFNMFVNDVKKISMISADEQMELLKLAQMGNKKARKKLIESNLRFILSVALQYKNSKVPVMDLVNEGVIGMNHSIDAFSEGKTKIKFISYSVWWIRASITKYIMEKSSMIRIPTNKVHDIRKALKESNVNGDNIPVELQAFMALKGSGVSLDKPVSESNSNTFGDLIEDTKVENPENIHNDYYMDDVIRSTINILPEREKNIIQMLFGLDSPSMSLREVGKELNLSYERVRQLKEQALRRILKSKNAEVLKERFLQSYEK